MDGRPDDFTLTFAEKLIEKQDANVKLSHLFPTSFLFSPVRYATLALHTLFSFAKMRPCGQGAFVRT